MSKREKTANIIGKIGKALSSISFVFAIIGVVGCIVGIVILARLHDFMVPSEWGDVTIAEYIYLSLDGAITVHTMIELMAIAALISAIEAVVSKLCISYFDFLIESREFYTFTGSKKLLVIGFLQIGLSILAAITVLFVVKSLNAKWDDVGNYTYNPVSPICFGIVAVVLGFVFKNKANQIQQEKDLEED